MKKIVLIAALLAAVAAQPAWAAKKAKAAANCYTPSAIEAEEGIRYITDLMIVSSVCQDTVYAEFRLRNRDTITAYQKALIAHYHGAAGFDRWNTQLANAVAQQQGGNQQICQQSAALLQQAKALDPKAFRAYAAAKAAANTQVHKCGK